MAVIIKSLHPEIKALSLDEKLEILKKDPHFSILVEQIYSDYLSHRMTVIM
ncbi:hypothetical protein [Leptospira idonii]|uniref:hypothetical protein n=1 Tax=Leptospira idonii TaxID=1193500 RepID=UPI001438470D|nr:hypothetical protein [Leptospira idonii]